MNSIDPNISLLGLHQNLVIIRKRDTRFTDARGNKRLSLEVVCNKDDPFAGVQEVIVDALSFHQNTGHLPENVARLKFRTPADILERKRAKTSHGLHDVLLSSEDV
jgi:hypothetical protein